MRLLSLVVKRLHEKSARGISARGRLEVARLEVAEKILAMSTQCATLERPYL